MKRQKEEDAGQKAGQESAKGGKKAAKTENSGVTAEKDKEEKHACPDDPADDLKSRVEILETEKKSLEDKLAKEKDDYIRLMAEFETFRRRTAEERLSLVTSASSETIKGMLPVLDDCERAIEMLKTSADEAAKEGTQLIYDKLMKYLKTKGLERIEAKGKKFDVDFHEAVAQLPVDEDMKGLVYDVVETGYTLGGRILRYAKVVVGI